MTTLWNERILNLGITVLWVRKDGVFMKKLLLIPLLVVFLFTACFDPGKSAATTSFSAADSAASSAKAENNEDGWSIIVQPFTRVKVSSY